MRLLALGAFWKALVHDHYDSHPYVLMRLLALGAF